MALYTPLARLGTFLFPNQSRRVSAPAPSSPHDGIKRRSAIAATDSPPRCRRRLSFADTDVVIEYAPSTPIASSAVMEAATALPNVPAEGRAEAWAEFAGLAAACNAGPGLEEPVIRRLFSCVFCNDSGPAPSAAELVAATSALDAVLSRATNPMSLRDEPLVDGVLRAAITHADFSPLIEVVANIVVRDDWGRVFSSVVAASSMPLANALLRALSSPDLESRTWEAQLQLLSVCAWAASRGPSEAESGYEDACPLPKKRTGGLSFSREDAAVVLGSFERLADRNAACTESALRALEPILSDEAVAAVFVAANASQVFSEVSSVHAQKVEVQHACIDLLVALSSPRILYHVPDL